MSEKHTSFSYNHAVNPLANRRTQHGNRRIRRCCSNPHAKKLARRLTHQQTWLY